MIQYKMKLELKSLLLAMIIPGIIVLSIWLYFTLIATESPFPLDFFYRENLYDILPFLVIGFCLGTAVLYIVIVSWERRKIKK
jgi:hypothetical protein